MLLIEPLNGTNCKTLMFLRCRTKRRGPTSPSATIPCMTEEMRHHSATALNDGPDDDEAANAANCRPAIFA